MIASRLLCVLILPACLIASQPSVSQTAQPTEPAPSDSQIAPGNDLQALPKLSLEQRAALRCSVAFALVDKGQKWEEAWAQQYPLLGERAREFFVRTAARLMDELEVSRAFVTKRIIQEAEAMNDKETIDAMMPGCLLMLDASGL